MVSRRHLLPLGLLVAALVGVVAIAARGRPLQEGGGTGSRLAPSFWSYFFTAFLVLDGLAVLATLTLFFLFRRPENVSRSSSEWRTARTIAYILAGVVLLTVVLRHTDLARLLHLQKTPPPPARTGPGTKTKPGSGTKLPNVRFRWDEFAFLVGLLLASGAVAYVVRSRPPGPHRLPGAESLAAALDESLEDLRDDPDLRRAIIAAYARMERALAAASLPRRPSEAPLEYLERALLALDTSAASVRRLTDLFERARFSQHEPDRAMREEAVEALAAVRDELRAAEPGLPSLRPAS